MEKRQKLVYDTGLGIVGIVLMVSVIALIFSHLRLSELESTAGQVSMVFSENLQEEYETMENIRLVSGAVVLISLSITTVLGDKYYKLHSNPQWEVKKGLAAGVFLGLFGIVFYLYIAPDLAGESIGLALLAFGVYSTLSNSAYLLILNSSDYGRETASGSDSSYCPNCGSSVSSSHSFCPDCGSGL